MSAGLTDHRSARRPGGFSLVEILVAIAILSLFMTSVFGALRLGEQSYRSGTTRAESSEEFRLVADFLRGRLAALVPVLDEQDELSPTSFTADAQQLQFVARAGRSQRPGLALYTLEEDRRSGEAALALSYTPLTPAAEETTAQAQRILLDRLEAVRFQFYGARKADGAGPEWHERWLAAEDGLPRLVKITLLRPAARTALELILPIHVEADS